MQIHLNLQNKLVRWGSFLIVLVLLTWLLKPIAGEFITGTLADKRVDADKDFLTAATEYCPESAQLYARLGEYEASEAGADFESAENHLQEAIKLSPNNYKYQLMLAEARDANGDPTGAEQAFADALGLAPNYYEVHWKYANFLVRQRKVEDSIEHFRFAVNTNPALIPATLDLLWAVSNKNISVLKSIVVDNQKGQLKLALLLANQSRFPESAEVFSKINKDVLLAAWESYTILDLMIDKGAAGLADNLWLQLKNDSDNPANSPVVWNGDFETESDAAHTEFDWKIGKSDYARIGIDNLRAHSGSHSLMLDFLGRDTTRLDNDVKHLITLRPGINYHLEYYVKTEDLKTEEGPRVVISDKLGNWIAQSEPIPAETNDWKRMVLNFTAPSKVTGDAAALYISVKRKPRYSYDKPMNGRIWLDDFLLAEGNGK